MKPGKIGWVAGLILFFLLILVFANLGNGGSGEQSPAATPRIGTERSFAGDFSTQVPAGSTVVAPQVIQVSGGNTCYQILDGDWPLKVLRRHGVTTDPGHGPYTVLDKYGNTRVDKAQDWGYIGTVWPGEWLCVNTSGTVSLPTPTPTAAYATPLPTFTPSMTNAPPVQQPEGTSLAVLQGTPNPTGASQPTASPGKALKWFIGAVLLIALAVVLIIIRLRRRAGQ